MKRETAILALIAIIAVSLFLLNQTPSQGEREIGLDEFKSIIQNQTGVANIMYFEKEDFKNQVVINCTIGLARSLGSLGKAVRNYAFDQDLCVKPDLGNATVAECMEELGGTYQFQIRYGPSSTRFFGGRTLIYVDENFTGECSLTSEQAT